VSFLIALLYIYKLLYSLLKFLYLSPKGFNVFIIRVIIYVYRLSRLGGLSVLSGRLGGIRHRGFASYYRIAQVPNKVIY
jgi:hypothetical protein